MKRYEEIMSPKTYRDFVKEVYRIDKPPKKRRLSFGETGTKKSPKRSAKTSYSEESLEPTQEI